MSFYNPHHQVGHGVFSGPYSRPGNPPPLPLGFQQMPNHPVQLGNEATGGQVFQYGVQTRVGFPTPPLPATGGQFPGFLPPLPNREFQPPMPPSGNSSAGPNYYRSESFQFQPPLPPGPRMEPRVLGAPSQGGFMQHQGGPRHQGGPNTYAHGPGQYMNRDVRGNEYLRGPSSTFQSGPAINGRPSVHPRPAMQSRTSTSNFPRSQYYCESCDKDLRSEEALDIHIAEKHELCGFPGCKYSARSELMRVHRLTHSGLGSGEDGTEEEVKRWLASRKRRFPRQDPSENHQDPGLASSTGSELQTPSEAQSNLEVGLRQAMRAAALAARKAKAASATSAPECAHWARTGKCPYGATCGFTHTKTGLCQFFLAHGRCRHGADCKYSHDRGEFKSKSRKLTLLQKLTLPETEQSVSRTVQAVLAIVASEYWKSISSKRVTSSAETEDSAEASISGLNAPISDNNGEPGIAHEDDDLTDLELDEDESDAASDLGSVLGADEFQ